MTIGVVIAAAGRGTRLGGTRPKALLSLAGEPMLARVVRAFLDHPGVASVVAAVGDPAEAGAALGDLARRVRLVRGGADRQESVRLGLEALEDTDLVLVHDAARPLVETALIAAVIEAAARAGAALPGLPVPDTVKKVAGDGTVAATLPRADLVLAQTPQGFRAAILRRAHAEAARSGFRATDDAALVERLGQAVAVVPGSPRNIKITSPADLRVAAGLLLEEAGDERG